MLKERISSEDVSLQSQVHFSPVSALHVARPQTLLIMLIIECSGGAVLQCHPHTNDLTRTSD